MPSITIKSFGEISSRIRNLNAMATILNVFNTSLYLVDIGSRLREIVQQSEMELETGEQFGLIVRVGQNIETVEEMHAVVELLNRCKNSVRGRSDNYDVKKDGVTYRRMTVSSWDEAAFVMVEYPLKEENNGGELEDDGVEQWSAGDGGSAGDQIDSEPGTGPHDSPVPVDNEVEGRHEGKSADHGAVKHKGSRRSRERKLGRDLPEQG